MDKNKKFQILFFDLDGTLTDSFEGISNSIIYALDKLGIAVNDRNDLRSFVGPPLKEEFMRKYNFSDELCNTAVSYFREYFEIHGMFENTVYENVPEMLSQLLRAGYVLVIATSKPEPYAKKILEHFDLSKYFLLIAGSELGGLRLTKSEVIAYALNRLENMKNSGEENVLPQINKKNILMIGDRHHDICGAKENGIASLGVLHGYGSLDELTQAGADYICETVKDISDFLI